MAQTGSFGNIVFQASAEDIHTFSGLNRKLKARFAEHPVLAAADGQQGKAKLQFMGTDLPMMTLSTFLDQNFTHVDYRIGQFEEAIEKGEHHPLVLGNKNYADYVLLSVDISGKRFDGRGNMIFAEVKLELKEYN